MVPTTSNTLQMTHFDDSLHLSKLKHHTYSVRGRDSCGTVSSIGRISQPIFVEAIASDQNEFSILSFTPYASWSNQNGTLEYTIEYDNAGIWMPLYSQNTEASYQDNAFLSLGKEGVSLEKCYRVTGENNSGQKTISNIVCVPYKPLVYVPNSFTPNNDGLNDVFNLTSFGIAEFNVSIYDRYGQKIIQFDDAGQGWNGNNYPQGTYMVVINTKDAKNQIQLHKTLLHLFR